MSLIDFFILIIATAYQAHGQACTWTWVQPSGSGSTLTRSVGAVATFSASVNDVLTDTALLTWKSNTNDLSIEEYSQATNTFTALVVDPRGVDTSFAALTSGTGHVYNMSFPTSTGETLRLTDTGASFTVTSQGCTSDGTSLNVLLSVSYCDLNAFSSEANAANTTDCGYNCVREFTCISDPTLSFQATCLVDATWSDTTPTAANRCKCECCDGSCAKKRTAIGFAASGSFIIAITDVYLLYLHQYVEYRVFKTWIPWIVSMPLLTAVAVTDWILIGISETADTIPPDATLTIGVVLTAVGTAALAATLYCHFKASKKNKTGTSNGGKPISGKVMPETEISDL